MIFNKDTLTIGSMVQRLGMRFNDRTGEFYVSPSYSGRVTAIYEVFDPVFGEDKWKFLIALTGDEDVEVEKYLNDLLGHSPDFICVPLAEKEFYMNPDNFSKAAKDSAYEHFFRNRFA